MATLVTQDFEREIAEKTVNGGTIQYDEFIFAMIPNLNADNLAQHLTIPDQGLIKHRQAVSQAGVINENAVVYSVTIGTEVGDFDFNWIGLINRRTNKLAVAVQTDTIKKTRNKNNVQGNSLTRNVLLEFTGAKQLTGISVDANTWQIDFSVRLHGIDEKIRLTNRDFYGRAVFFDDAFLVKRGTGNNYTIDAGHAYVEGVRAELKQTQTIQAPSLPCSIYLDVVHHCTVTGAYETEIKFLKQSKSDYLDTTNKQHYVQIIADIDRSGVVTDRRLLPHWLGITPKDLDDTTTSTKDKTGHTHRLPLASLVKKGLVQLYSGYDSDREDLSATPKAVKGLKGLIDSLTRNLNNYIPNSKKSDATNSNSSDTVATSRAVKTVADLFANYIPNSKKSSAVNSNSEDTVGTSKAVKIAYDRAVEAEKKGLPIGAIVAFPKEVNNPNGFLLCNGTRFSQSTYGDLYRVLGRDVLPDLVRSDIGMLAYFPVDQVPKGWFECNGQTINPSTHSELASFLRNTYGTNKLPNAQDRFIRNAGNGLRVGQTQEDQIKEHVHGINFRLHNENGVRNNCVASGRDVEDVSFNGSSESFGGNETRPKSIVFKLCIKGKDLNDGVRYWIKAFGDVQNAGALDASRLAQGLQLKADLNHQHRSGDITDFEQAVNNVINQSFTYQKIGDFEIWKFPNGLMIQTYRWALPAGRNSPAGGDSFNWAVAFVDKPRISISAEINSANQADTWINLGKTGTGSKCVFYINESYFHNEQKHVEFHGIGRWK
ncbi:phage tail protein [Pasteurella sp. PK-2025]|uniref:phage tail-collar fiber domain-containing protein n=1 Tax=Pasteurella sp. PK-2025 TaxID=3413133 RepID=UPI003C70830E